jgi:hypothetical protein
VIPAQRPPSSFAAGDPRARQDGLGWVARAVFPDPALRLTVGDDRTVAARCAVIPALDHARFLLPLASARVTAASVLAYNALRPPKVRASRAAIGLLARAGALGLTRAPCCRCTADRCCGNTSPVCSGWTACTPRSAY